jgi:hypothetical protein
MFRSNVKAIFGGLAAVAAGIVAGPIFVGLTNDAASLTVEAPVARIGMPLSNEPAPASVPAAPADAIGLPKPEVLTTAQPQAAPETTVPETGVEPARGGSSVARKRKKLRDRTARADKDDDDD